MVFVGCGLQNVNVQACAQRRELGTGADVRCAVPHCLMALSVSASSHLYKHIHTAAEGLPPQHAHQLARQAVHLHQGSEDEAA